MREEKGDLFEHLPVPQIEFSAEQDRVKAGRPLGLRWQVHGADEVRLWVHAGLAGALEPLDWVQIGRLGELAPAEGHREWKVEAATGFYLVAKGPQGMSGRRLAIEVERVVEPPEGEVIWSPQKQFLPLMEVHPHLAWAELQGPGLLAGPPEGLKALGSGDVVWHAGAPPIIQLTASPQVIFDTETGTVSWSVTNSNCATKSQSVRRADLLVDLTQVSGTKPGGGGWGAGGMPACALDPSGTEKVPGPAWKHGSQWHVITASNAQGGSAVASRGLDVLTSPTFAGNATVSRQTGVRTALRTIDVKLRNGAVYNDASLDAKVDAFQKGYLNRKAFWATLLRELENIGVDTFDCQDVADSAWGGGHWKQYANTVILDWSPSHTPYLEYVIAHELCHKCGFNSTLYAHYTHVEIETQCHAVSGAIIP